MTASLSVYDGLDLMGTIVDGGKECKAFDAKDRALGKFRSTKAAVEAIYTAYEAGMQTERARPK